MLTQLQQDTKGNIMDIFLLIDEVVMNVKRLTHSQQQPQAPRTHKKKPTIRQAIRTVFFPPKGSFLTDSWS